MASKRLLKKNINYLFGDLIDQCYLWELVNTDDKSNKAETIVDEIVEYYDEVMTKINSGKGAKYFSELTKKVEIKATEIASKINDLT